MNAIQKNEIHMLFFLSYRKADMREFKMLQRGENKQYQDLIFKSQFNKEALERKSEQDMQVINEIDKVLKVYAQ